MRYAYVVLSALHISCLINHNRRKKLSLKRYFEQISGFKYFRKIQNALLVGFMLNITPGVNIDEIWHKDSFKYLFSSVPLITCVPCASNSRSGTRSFNKSNISQNNNSSNNRKNITYDKMISVVSLRINWITFCS